MIRLELLLKVFRRPGEVFEELKGRTTWKDGLIVYITALALSFLIGSATINATKFGALPIACGFGSTLKPLSVVVGIITNLAGVALLAWVLHHVARKMGGRGDLGELFGMFCYTRVLFVFRAFASLLLSAYAYYMVQIAIAKALSGEVISPSLLGVRYGAIAAIYLFFVWEIVLLGSALSKSHNLPRIKSIALTTGVIFLISIINFGMLIILT